MADFSTAYKTYVKPWEGGYSLVAADKGGETYAGIARKFHPTWEGWSYIDIKKSMFPNKRIPQNHFFPDIEYMVTAFYKAMWDRNLFGQINNQQVASLLYDYYVNSGSYAIKAVQRLVGTTADGAMGPKTIAAINAANQSQLHDALKKQRGEHYEALIRADSSQEIFRKGWFARLASFPDLTSPGGIGIVAGLLGTLAVIFFLTQGKKKKVTA